ncbi:MAG TPA: DUF397 domain-containing protein [Streptosporangiaceae bacterium]|nr:DUF397 domain-containing protein [Streptosporangiaceae bacterium]
MDELSWRKSSRSGSNGEQCVEVARTAARTIAARDSKSPNGPVLRFGRSEWRRFLDEIRRGTHDL